MHMFVSEYSIRMLLFMVIKASNLKLKERFSLTKRNKVRMKSDKGKKKKIGLYK